MGFIEGMCLPAGTWNFAFSPPRMPWSRPPSSSHAPTHLVCQHRQQPLVLEQLNNHGIAKAKARAGLVLAPKGAQEPVVAAAAADGAEHAGAVKALKHDACGRKRKQNMVQPI